MIALLIAGLTLQQTPPPFFNGTDLTGWHNVNCAPGTFFVKDQMIITTGKPTGYLRSDKHYENFVLEFEWQHRKLQGIANSGMFVWGDALPALGTGYTRSIEVQVLCGFEDDFAKKNPGKKSWASDHGDLFSIWGAKCKPDRPHPQGIERCNPSENRSKGAGQWNHYKVTGNNGVLKLEVNGKEVSGVSGATPRKGYIAIESEGSECWFRNFKMTELSSTNPKPEEIATVDEGFRSLFDGLTLDGWQTEDKAWTASDGVLRCAKVAPLTKKVPKGEVTLDVALPAKFDGEAKVNGQAITGKGWKRIRVPVDGELTITPIAGLSVRNIFAKPQ